MNDFETVMEKILAVHKKKASDYTGNHGEFFNFQFAARFAEISMEKGFRYIIGIKLARLEVLLEPDRIPENEPIDDTILDLAVYLLIWLAYRNRIAEQRSKNEV